MNGYLMTVLALATVPVLASFLGSLITSFREPSEKLRNASMHLAAGVILATAAVEFMPTAREGGLVVIPAFALGVVVMLGLSVFSRRMEAREGISRWPTGTLVATGIDLLVDGLVLGVGFVAALSLGVILTVALSIEFITIAVALSAMLSKRGISRAWTIAVPPALSLLMVVGVAIGTVAFLGRPIQDFAPVLAFGSAALLYLVTEELLAEAHQEGESILMAAMFFAGFLVFLVMDALELAGTA